MNRNRFLKESIAREKKVHASLLVLLTLLLAILWILPKAGEAAEIILLHTSKVTGHLLACPT